MGIGEICLQPQPDLTKRNGSETPQGGLEKGQVLFSRHEASNQVARAGEHRRWMESSEVLLQALCKPHTELWSAHCGWASRVL